MDSPPEDAMKFMEYLEEIGVPKLAIVKKKDWKGDLSNATVILKVIWNI